VALGPRLLSANVGFELLETPKGCSLAGRARCENGGHFSLCNECSTHPAEFGLPPRTGCAAVSRTAAASNGNRSYLVDCT